MMLDHDPNGRKPGQSGFIPPAYSTLGKTAEEMAEEMPEGYDTLYHDGAGRRPGDPDFEPPAPDVDHETIAVHHTVNAGYDANYRDANGKAPGEEGFVPPNFTKQQHAMEAGTYTKDYVDPNGQRPGDRGFIPPLRGIADAKRRAMRSLRRREKWEVVLSSK